MVPCNLWELASLYSPGLVAVILHKRKCLIMADEMKEKIDTFVLGASYLFSRQRWWMTGPVSSVCLSFAVVQSDQGQAPTEKGPVPKLMSSIIQMGSLLSVRCAVVWTPQSQAADAPPRCVPAEKGGNRGCCNGLDLTGELINKALVKQQRAEWLCCTAASEGFRQKSEEDYPLRCQTRCQCRIKQ